MSGKFVVCVWQGHMLKFQVIWEDGLPIGSQHYEKLLGFYQIQHKFITIKYFFFTVINAGYDIFCHKTSKGFVTCVEDLYIDIFFS